MSAAFSTSTEVGMLDARTSLGSVTLPLTTDIPSRMITLKDVFGTAANSTITIKTQGSDLFEDGTTSKTMAANYDFMTLHAGSTNRWYIHATSLPPTMTMGSTITKFLSASNATISSINGAVPLLPANIASTIAGLGTAGYVSSGQVLSSITVGAFLASTVTANVATFSTLTATYNGSTGTAVGSYGPGLDTLVLKTSLTSYSSSVASLFFGTGTASYPLARIAAIETAKAGPGSSALLFQTTFPSTNIGNTGVNLYFNTGADQFYTVPAGVTSIAVTMWSAGGGGSWSYGGPGAYIKGTLTVTPGQTLKVIAGSPGVYSGSSATYGGGGAGGVTGTNPGSGGGRSAIGYTLTPPITAATASGTAITYTMSSTTGLVVGYGVTVSGLTTAALNISGLITAVAATTFTIASTASATTITSQSGAVYLELVDVGGGGGSYGGGSGDAGGGGITTGQPASTNNGNSASGGTQTAGGVNPSGNAGSMFQGGAGISSANGGGGGGGGWFGGAGGNSVGSGAGGSSYTSFPGFTLINSAITTNFVRGTSNSPAPMTSDPFYTSTIAVGGYVGYTGSNAMGGGGLVVIVTPPQYVMSEAMRIATGGNVGIGTSTPTTLLDIAGTTRSQALSSLTMNASTITLDTGKLSTLNVLGSINMTNTPISNIATTSYSPVYSGNPNQGAGGTYTTYVSSGVIMAAHIFSNVGTATFTPTQNITGAQVLILGGGGSGGGSGYGGGGGAGGLVYITNMTISTSGAPYSVVVGAGGAAISTTGYGVAGNNGTNSSAFGYAGIGGGGGGSDGTTGGKSGGCGGGAGYSSSYGTGTQGYNGGIGNNPASGGGGGGMGSVGSNYNSVISSAGGNGVVYSIVGSNVGYAAGGGAATGNATAPIGGSANGSIIGGTGGVTNTSGTAGAPNTGSGGGGCTSFTPYTSGAGAAGIVVLAYPTAQYGTYTVNVGSITGDANSNLSLQATYKLNITGNTSIAGALSVSTMSTSVMTAASATMSTITLNTATLSTATVSGSLNMSYNNVSSVGIMSFSKFSATNLNATAGGTYTTYTSSATTYALHAFTTVGTTTFSPLATITGANVLIVGGGGGGGEWIGGGGGGGYVTALTNQTIAAGSYSIVVGAGGGGAYSTGASGINGSNGGASSAFGNTANGGGGGGSYNGAAPGTGGGGYGAAGSASGGYGAGLTNVPVGCNGGNGVQNGIAGSLVYYAGGGGGSAYSSGGQGTGGLGGGSAGANQPDGTSASSATFYGGGGGGATRPNPTVTAGSGYQGVVYIAYTLAGPSGVSIGTFSSDSLLNFTISPANTALRLQGPTEWRSITSSTAASAVDLTSAGAYFATTYRLSAAGSIAITFPTLTTGAWWVFTNATAATQTLTTTGTTTGLAASYALQPATSITFYSDGNSYYTSTTGSTSGTQTASFQTLTF